MVTMPMETVGELVKLLDLCSRRAMRPQELEANETCGVRWAKTSMPRVGGFLRDLLQKPGRLNHDALMRPFTDRLHAVVGADAK